MNILVTVPLSDEQKQRFEACTPSGSVIEYIPINDLTAKHVSGREIIFGTIPKALVKSADSLKWLQLSMSGYEGYPELMGDALLTNARGAFGLAVSEHMLAMLFSLKKRLHQYRDNQSASLWHDEGNVTSIDGSLALTVGLGNIGGMFAKKLKALGAYNIGIRQNILDCPDYIDELYTLDAIDALLPRADIVALAVPSSDATYKLMDKKRLSILKEGAVLLNVGRGSAIDTDALCAELESGRITAGLDVTDPEPLPSSHPLWQQPGCIITPHISGFFHLPQTLDFIVDIACDNMQRFLSNTTLKNVVNNK